MLGLRPAACIFAKSQYCIPVPKEVPFPDTLCLRSERDPHHRSRDVTVPVLQVKNPA